LWTIFKTDTIWLINNSEDKSMILSTFLSQWETTIRQATLTAQQLQSTIAQDNANLVVCQANKASADTRYNQWLTDNNAVLVQDATEKATEYNECIARLSTSIKSNQWVVNRLGAAITKTQSYIGLIRANQSTILSHPELINSSTPSDILQLQKDLTTLRNS
jgi:phage shock protein A